MVNYMLVYEGVQMNRRNLLFVNLFIFVMLILPQTGLADKVALYDADLSEIIGQEGLVGESTIPINTHVDNMTVMNGLVNLNDVNIQGSITTKASSMNPSIVNEMTNLDLPGDGKMDFVKKVIQFMGLGSQQIDQTINIDLLTIGAIRLGNDISSPSFGDLYMNRHVININGSSSVMPH
jgi:hypothetical protein